MTQAIREELLAYYNAELEYLHRSGAAFARQYPKVAGRLELGGDESADPHVERLLESFAFLTARIQRNLDEHFPEIASALLDTLYPQLQQPIPSMSIARFDVDPDQGKLTTGYSLPAQTPLFAESRDGVTCRFRTCYPLTLWPIEVVDADFVSTAGYDFLDGRSDVATVLRIRLRALGGTFDQLSLDRLRFYLNGETRTLGQLYEMVFAHTVDAAVLPAGGTPSVLTRAALEPVGFGADDEVLPYPQHAHPAYRMVQEYFAFPRKYLFLDVARLAGRMSGTEVDLLLMLDQLPPAGVRVERDTFCLGCTPIINLFRRTSEPIRLDHRQLEYRLVPDTRRERSTEVHSIRTLSMSSDETNETQTVKPFFSFDHAAASNGANAFYQARRVETGRKDVPGTELLLTFLDLKFNPRLPSSPMVFAHTLCTNRGLAEQVPAGAALDIELAAPVARITALHRPTTQMQPPLGGAALWRLISHLSLNHLSLLEQEAGPIGLREILRLYSPYADAAVENQIAAVRALECSPSVRRMTGTAWRGFCRGTEISLTIDEDAFAGGTGFLFGSVLRHFFGLYTAINSFTRLTLRSTRREADWMTWPALAGEQHVL